MLHSSAAVKEDAQDSPMVVKCPFCGHGAGIYRKAVEERTPSTPIRCLSCGRDAVLDLWCGPTVSF
jgi:ribosomal protein S27E